MDQSRDRGLLSLRRAQIRAALDGNPTMLIWLGKQMLGQKEPIERKEVILKDPGNMTLEELSEWAAKLGDLSRRSGLRFRELKARRWT